MGRVAIGVDIGGTNIRAARVAVDGRLDGLRKVRTDAGRASDLVLELVRDLMDADVAGIGIGIPGRLDRDGTTVLSAGYVDLAGQRLGEVIGAAVGRPTVLDNDAHMALIAEMALGAATGVHHVAMFTVGTGIGGAIALDGHVVRGKGNAGQLGHLSLDLGGPLCNCGRRGCSEVLASGTALNRRMREAGLPDGTTAQALLDHADEDPTAADVLRGWSGAWRAAIDTVAAAVDPDLVVLGGGLGGAAVMALQRFHPDTSAWFATPVAAATLGDDAGVIGAGLRGFSA